jgi:hypothetical protein
MSRTSLRALIILALTACLGSGCFDGGGGYNYGYPDYPAGGYAPYAWSGPAWGSPVYHPDFDYHHPWEEHHDYGGHQENFYHPPVARPAPVAHVGSFSHPSGGHPVSGGHDSGHH